MAEQKGRTKMGEEKAGGAARGSTEAIDKSKWGPGPWQDEPDRIEFEHAGLPCLMLRGPVGAWCGYAAVPPGHPLHGKGYSELYDYDTETGVAIEVHGGLTYASECSGDICHEPKPGEPDNVWWFGFDCSHCDDLAPSMAAYWREKGKEHLIGHDVYRDAAYVRAQVRHLAEQLASTAGAPKEPPEPTPDPEARRG